MKIVMLEVCPKCGSVQVEHSAWLKTNTGIDTGSEGPVSHCWCPDCDSEIGGLEQAHYQAFSGSGYWIKRATELMYAPARAPEGGGIGWPAEPWALVTHVEPGERADLVKFINGTMLADEIAWGRRESMTVHKLKDQLADA